MYALEIVVLPNPSKSALRAGDQKFLDLSTHLPRFVSLLHRKGPGKIGKICQKPMILEESRLLYPLIVSTGRRRKAKPPHKHEEMAMAIGKRKMIMSDAIVELNLEDLDQVSGGRTVTQEISLLHMEVATGKIRPWQAQKDLLIWEEVQAQAQLNARRSGNAINIQI
jgi:hypothetical protein